MVPFNRCYYRSWKWTLMFRTGEQPVQSVLPERNPSCKAHHLCTICSACRLRLVGVNMLSPLLATKEDYTYILVTGYCNNRWLERYPILNHAAVIISEEVVNLLFCCFFILEQFHSDYFSQFDYGLISELCVFMIVKKSYTTPCLPTMHWWKDKC